MTTPLQPGVITAPVETSGTSRPTRGSSWLTSTTLAVAGLAILARLVPAALSYGTSDVMAWELLARLLLDGENFYATQLHNWPVLWVYFAAGAMIAHETTGLSFSTLVKVPPILADALAAVLVYRATGRAGLGLAYALNPVSILVTAYHGQFDAMMLAPTVLAWYLWPARARRGPTDDTSAAQRPGSGTEHRSGARVPLAAPGDWRLVASGLALGLGVWFKPVPLILLPVLLPRLATWRARLLYALLAVAPAALGTLPYFVRWPADVAANFLNYSSWFGQWGFAVVWMVVEYVRYGNIPWWLPDPDFVSRPLRFIFDAGRWGLLAALAATWWLTYRRGFDVLLSIVATFVVFYFFTSGFGVQYLLWVIPFALAARERWLWPYTVAATGALLVAYALGLAYVPHQPLPDNGPSQTEFVVKLATLPTWLVCGLWTSSLLRRRWTQA